MEQFTFNAKVIPNFESKSNIFSDLRANFIDLVGLGNHSQHLLAALCKRVNPSFFQKYPNITHLTSLAQSR